MKIFGIGLSKTGTTSLTEALGILGFSSIHYPHDRTTYAQILDADFNFKFLQQHDAVTDVTIVRYYPQLDSLYPGSKFILTTREMTSWLESCQRHWARRVPSPEKMNFNTMIDVSVYGCGRFNAERFRHVYEQHVRDVRRHFAGREHDFLEIDLTHGEGWPRLCGFLNRDVPKKPFPHLHKTKKSKTTDDQYRKRTIGTSSPLLG